ncbi:Gfo/Idh/MocA family oxidoreductase [Chloroflexia bacterium SDU3-3]|nr:Gfo/Idh/MocA family oxidoreductase [Chloroflexia bacterium SDU3-3]
MSTQKLRVGVIGAGIGALHLAAYNQIPDAEVVALAGLDDDRVRRVAAEHHVPQTYREYEQMLAAPNVDAVSVCLPNALHAPVALAALQAGKHVLVEKPLARNAQEARAILDAAQAQSKVLMVSFDKRHRADVQWIKRYIDSGALGQIYYAKAHWMRRAGIPRLGSWFVSKEQAGGGPLVDLGVHVLDIAMYLMGEPAPLAVSASAYAEFGPRGLKGWQGREQFSDERLPYEVEDLATAFVRLGGGATLLLEASWATHSSAGDDFGVTLYGTEGGVELMVRNYTTVDTVRVFTDIGGVATDMAPKIPKSDGHLEVISRFVSAVVHGTPAIPSADDGLRRNLVLDAAYQSAAEGREITIS